MPLSVACSGMFLTSWVNITTSDFLDFSALRYFLKAFEIASIAFAR